MTSKNSFFNLLKEDLHRRLWTLILSGIVFFGTFGVAFTMILQNLVGRYSGKNYGLTQTELAERVAGRICEEFYSFYPWFIFVAVVGAIICAMNGFAYLHSRKQVDFYHSLPVKREKIFAVRLLNGVLIYALPYLVGLFYTYLLCALYRVMSWDIFFCGLFFFVFHLMGYVIMYLAAVFAMMLTGKMVIAFFGICIVNLYAPVIYSLGTILKDTFFVTSYGGSVNMESALLATRWLSPASYYFSLLYSVEGGEESSRFWLEFLSFLVLAAVLIALNLWLYKKRASEKADSSMAFKITEPVVRMMLSIPIGILAGLMFFSLQYDGDSALLWLIFGGLLGGFLAHGIIEALYQGDIKKCLSHKVQMAVAMVLAAVIPLLFLYDVFGYDSYLPDKKKIESMAVVSSELRFGSAYYDKNGWISANEYALENMEVTNIDAMYELAQLLAEDASKNRDERFLGYRDYYGTVESGSYDNEAPVHFTTFTIRYTLKNGSEAIRTYEYDYYAVMELLERIYNDTEYKKAVHPLFSLLKAGHPISQMDCYAPASGITIALKQNYDAVLATYAEEFLTLSFEDLITSAPIGELNVYFSVGQDVGDRDYTDSTTILVYPEMTRTLAMLQEQGYPMQNVQEAENVSSVTVYYSGTANDLRRNLGLETSDAEIFYEDSAAVYENYEEYYEKYGYYPATQAVAIPEYYQEVSVTFTDPTEIAAIKEQLIFRSYSGEFGPFPMYESFLRADVFFEQEYGVAYENGIIAWTDQFRFRKGGVPQFVIDRIFEEMGATE